MGITWRLDPSESFSDYTIEILVKTGAEESVPTTVITYHVHKALLAVGDRKSEYFFNLFKGGNFQETESAKSQIALPEPAALAFPVFLDFLYDPYKPLAINTINAIPLLYLGHYFDVEKLRVEANVFWKGDYTFPSAMAVYYKHATTIKVAETEEILDQIVAFCVKDIDGIASASEYTTYKPLFETFEPSFWSQILEKLPSNLKSSLNASYVVSRFSEYHSCSCEHFQELTSENKMPIVSSLAATHLMELEIELLGVDQARKLSSLQDRCIQALAQDWFSLGTRDSEQMNRVFALGHQNPSILCQLIALGFGNAQLEMSRFKPLKPADARSLTWGTATTRLPPHYIMVPASLDDEVPRSKPVVLLNDRKSTLVFYYDGEPKEDDS